MASYHQHWRRFTFGNWYVWDTARGVSTSNDPYLLLNSTAAEVTNTDYINERCYAMRLLGKAYDTLGQNGVEWFIKATKEAPNTREPWVELAQSYYAKKMWSECHEAAMK